MKKVLLLFMFVSFSVFSQSLENLKTETKKLYQANYLLDFDEIASLTYPKISETIGADNIYDKLEQHYENDEYRLRLQLETVPFKYGEIKKIEGRTFCLISCSNPIRYTFNNKLTKDGADNKANWIMGIAGTITATFEPARNSFNVRRTTTFIAVSDATTNNQWRFFNFDNVFQQDIFNATFDESTKKELGL
jgi:hypothetical protein